MGIAWVDRWQNFASQKSRDFAIAIAVCGALAMVSVADPIPRLIWNASASAPIGLYWLSMDRGLERGELVLVWLPQKARKLAAERLYLPYNTPALKRVAALPGDRVCATDRAVFVNEILAATVLSSDRAGRVLTSWVGCVTLSVDQVFLLNPDSSGSFDGRYFGPSEQHDIVGRLVGIWV
ncbi:MAG: S26 family signal peptidase [Micropepsaceae bacterium]